jgi:hypothetical protein
MGVSSGQALVGAKAYHHGMNVSPIAGVPKDLV